MDVVNAAIAREKPVSIDGLLELARPDMAKVDALIRDRMQSPVSVIPALAEHLIGGSAKRLRPLLTIAAARVAGAQDDACLKLAAAVVQVHPVFGQEPGRLAFQMMVQVPHGGGQVLRVHHRHGALAAHQGQAGGGGVVDSHGVAEPRQPPERRALPQ